MKNRTAIITCSNACIDYIDHDFDIRIFRSSLHFGNKDYLDFIDISANDFYQKLEDNKSLSPKTSFMPLGEMIKIYQKLVQEGYTSALVITVSKELSGIYNASKIASNLVEDLEVTVFDSKTFSYPQAKMVLTAAKMIRENKDIPEVIKELEFIRDNNKTYFAVDTLSYLVKSGRLSNSSGFIGNKIKIKPILVLNEGKVEIFEKIRTSQKAVEKIINLFIKETKGLKIQPFITHANNPEIKDYIIKRLKEHDENIDKIINLPLTAVVGAHAGPKTIGLGYCITK